MWREKNTGRLEGYRLGVDNREFEIPYHRRAPLHAAGFDPYDALLVLSFGGPERPEDVLPFLENVTRGRNVPRERLLEVAEHYHHFGGKSPINEQNRALIGALTREFEQQGPRLPIYFGNRNWHPLLTDTVRQMASGGRATRSWCSFTSAFSSYSGCRQYRENIEAALREVGPAAPRLDRLRMFFNHPLFIETMAERMSQALSAIPADRSAARFSSLQPTASHWAWPRIANTRHSFARHAGWWPHHFQGSPGNSPIKVAAAPLASRGWNRTFSMPSALANQGTRDVVVVPIGFVSDHLEVLYDLDFEARQLSDSLGLNMVRAGTVGTAPKFVSMIRELVLERIEPGHARRAVGTFGPSHDVCPTDCCLPAKR